MYQEKHLEGYGVKTVTYGVSREELQSIQRELEVLSEQYSQKCLENAHLAQALEAERQALQQCQRENQELNAHNQVCHQHASYMYRNTLLSTGSKRPFLSYRS